MRAGEGDRSTDVRLRNPRRFLEDDEGDRMFVRIEVLILESCGQHFTTRVSLGDFWFLNLGFGDAKFISHWLAAICVCGGVDRRPDFISQLAVQNSRHGAEAQREQGHPDHGRCPARICDYLYTYHSSEGAGRIQRLFLATSSFTTRHGVGREEARNSTIGRIRQGRRRFIAADFAEGRRWIRDWPTADG